MITTSFKRTGAPRRPRPDEELKRRRLLRLHDRASSLETIRATGPQLLAGLRSRIAELEGRP